MPDVGEVMALHLSLAFISWLTWSGVSPPGPGSHGCTAPASQDLFVSHRAEGQCVEPSAVPLQLISELLSASLRGWALFQTWLVQGPVKYLGIML